MRAPRRKQSFLSFAAAIALLTSALPRGHADTVVTNCTGAASLQAALAAGGQVTFTCDGTLIPTNTLTIATNVVLNGLGHSITVSGSNGFRLFNVNTGITFTVLNLTLANGASTNGGAIYNRGTLIASNCIFIGNTAAGSNGLAGLNGSDSSVTGNPGGAGGSGTPGWGGAIYNLGTSAVSRCVFLANSAVGGNGANGGNGGNVPSNGFGGGKGGSGGAGAAGLGGAIYNLGALIASSCSFSSNSVIGGNAGVGGTGGSGPKPGYNGSGAGGAPGEGAGLYNASLRLAIINSCVFSGNACIGGSSTQAGTSDSGFGQNGAPGGDGLGGGIFNAGTNSVVNSTFSTNKVTAGNGANGGNADNATAGNGGNGGTGAGGGLYNSGVVSVTNCTFVGGSAQGGTNGVAGSGTFPGSNGSPGGNRGGNFANAGTAFNLKNTILANSLLGSNSFGAILDRGYNLSTDRSIPFNATGSHSNVLNLLLGPLADNGGPTRTFLLQAGSAAIDAGDPGFCLPTDQRGVLRPAGTNCDVGAYEFGGSPTVTSQPASQTVTNGGTLVFSVAATGEQPLSYQWRMNTTNITSATNATLTLTNVQFTDHGNYDVVITNSFGSTNSAVAVLSVLLPPAITLQPTGQTNGVGAQITFNVGSSGDAPLFYQWFFNGTAITNATIASYTIGSVRTNDAGNYQVVVSNAVGVTTSAVATLTIIVPPVITTQPTNAAVASGASVTFRVVATGSDPLGYQWRFNGTNLLGATLPVFTISNAKTNNAGVYDVIVSNGAGTTPSDPVTLTIIVPPVITTQPTSATVTNGAAISFHVVATGSNPLAYQWRFNGTNLSGASQNVFMIGSANPSNAGVYDVIVSNGAGNAPSDPAVLKVIVPTTATAPGKSATTFSLAVASQLGVNYTLEYAPTFPSATWTAVTTLNGNGSTLTLSDTNAVAPTGFYRLRMN